MKKIFVLLLAVLVFALPAQAVFAQELLPLKDTRNAEKFGYQDNTGKAVIPPKFAEVYMFSENIGIVMVDGWDDGYGGRRDYINIKGDVITGHIHKIDNISFFSNGYGLIGGITAQGNKDSFFFVDANGKIVSKEYEDAYSFSDGAALVKENGKWFAVDTKFTVLCETPGEPYYWWQSGAAHYNYFKSGLLAVSSDGKKWGAIDKTGKTIIPQTLDGSFAFNGNYAALYGRNDKNFQVIDRKGAVVYSYESDKSFSIIDYLEDGKIISYNETYNYRDGTQVLEVMLHDIANKKVTKEIEYNGSSRYYNGDYFWAAINSRFMYKNHKSAFWNICRSLLEKEEKGPVFRAAYPAWYGRYLVEYMEDRFIDINTFAQK